VWLVSSLNPSLANNAQVSGGKALRKTRVRFEYLKPDCDKGIIREMHNCVQKPRGEKEKGAHRFTSNVRRESCC
jgi:hypothetical protein